ncbi:hypothetical protein PV325_012010 [Microctonus aethiopoides]|nr:hypothetical protein PV325_012010 [Microctonus aethiopoides]
MFCTRCQDIKLICYHKLDVETLNIQGNIRRIDCKVCKNFIAIAENETIINIDKIIDNSQNGWKKVRSNREKIIYYALSQIIYPEIDKPEKEKYEAIYDYADNVDEILIRWINGRPIGFYTVKLKGTEIYGSTDKYSMNTLDTAYIRSQYRNCGFGMEILYDIVNRHSDQDIGFSKPISYGMLQVLNKFLTAHKECRLRFWEIENGGIEGSIKLVWFIIQRKKKYLEL